MNSTTELLVFAVLTSQVLACAQTDHVVTTVPKPTPTPSMLVEPTLEGGALAPVSISHPSAGAKQAFAKCLVGDVGGSGMYSVDMVSGMAQVSSARDLYRYLPLTGREPELQRDLPAWVIRFRGDLTMSMNTEIWTDPACVVMADTSGFYAVGPTRPVGSEVARSPEPPAIAPDRTLPPLVP